MKLCQSKESYIVHVEKEIHMDKMLLISIIGLISTMVWSTLKFTATCKVERQAELDAAKASMARMLLGTIQWGFAFAVVAGIGYAQTPVFHQVEITGVSVLLKIGVLGCVFVFLNFVVLTIYLLHRMKIACRPLDETSFSGFTCSHRRFR